jgi:uncharacterized damage-inducible protein DinB
MLPLFEEYLSALERLHDGVAQAIAGLPLEALDWVPGPDIPSLAVLVVHLTGAQRYWIGDVVGQDPSGRDRAAEFRVSGLDAAALRARLDQTLTHSRGVLEDLTVKDMDTIRVSPRDGREYTVAWALCHALEHTALHLGHIQIVRQLWDQRKV